MLYRYDSQQTEDGIENASHLQFTTNIKTVPISSVPDVYNYDTIIVVTSNESEKITIMGEQAGDTLSRTHVINEDLNNSREYAPELPVRFQNSDSQDSCPCRVIDQILSRNDSTLQEFDFQVPDGKDSSDTDIDEDLIDPKEYAQELRFQLQRINLEESCPCEVTDQIASGNDSTLQEFAIQVRDGKNSTDRAMNQDQDNQLDLRPAREDANELPVQLQNTNLEDCRSYKAADQRASENDCVIEEFAFQVPNGNDSRGTATRSSSLSSSTRYCGMQENVNTSDNGNEVNVGSGSSMVWWVSVARTISAGLYLFDFVSSMLVVKQYYDLDYHPAKVREFSQGHIQGAFPSFLVIVGMAHTSNAIAFKLALPPEHQPIRSAYFLPLLQLQRLISGLWATGSCDQSSIHSHELQEAEALYAIMGAAIEAAPQLALQSVIFFHVGTMYTYYSSQTCTPSRDRWCVVGGAISVKPWKPSTIVKVSLISSLLSGAYNGGRAIKYQTLLAGCKMSYMHALVAGLYTFAALVLRCTTITTLAFIGNDNYRIFVNGNSTSSGPLDPRFISIFIVGFAIPTILFWMFLRPKKMSWIGNSSLLYFGARIVQSSIFGYVSLFLGPIYPMISDARARNKLRNHKFYMKLLLLMSTHLCLDVFALLISITSGNVDPCGPTLDKFTYYGHSPPLSATLTCTRFLAFVILGATLSFLSMLTFVFFLKRDMK